MLKSCSLMHNYTRVFFWGLQCKVPSCFCGLKSFIFGANFTLLNHFKLQAIAMTMMRDLPCKHSMYSWHQTHSTPWCFPIDSYSKWVMQHRGLCQQYASNHSKYDVFSRFWARAKYVQNGSKISKVLNPQLPLKYNWRGWILIKKNIGPVPKPRDADLI